MTLVEDETTVEEGAELRASTYALTPAADTPTTYAGTTTTLKYFPVTLYDYDKETFNQALHKIEVDAALASESGIRSLTKWNGIYFGNGAGTDDYTYTTNSKDSYDSTTVYYSENGDYSTYINKDYYVDVGGTKYLVTGLSCERSGWFIFYTYSWTITYDGGAVPSSNSSITLYKASNTATVSLEFADHNKWTGDFTSNKVASGNRIYSGIAQATLDANKNILFNYPDGGLFNSDTSVKTIYTNVGLPFVYDASNGYYTFDASEFGAYFHTDSTQGTSSTPASNTNLYYDKNVQKHDFDGQDGATNGWFPFNDGVYIYNGDSSKCRTDVNYSRYGNTANYYFGMNATIPFTMTANGCMNPTDDNSTPIKFTFSGDDDVWVFIDGQLILDIGGDHNKINGEIDFSTNTWSITRATNAGGDFGDAATPPIETTGSIFNDGTVKNYKINQSRETFAATDSHELTIYYLEQGGGSSNCRISFNLPMKDSVSVKKLVRDTDSDGQHLDAETLAQINNRDFGFTLYKDGNAVANTNYNLLNENGQYISTSSTDANGHFTLKNGQTAKFVGVIKSNSYYVVEDKDADADDFWLAPTWTYTDEVAKGTNSNDSTTNGQSMTVTATGSDEAEDSIVFTCTNTWVHQGKASISAVDDKIVIDYGLPVVIDVLANDTVSNGTKSIEDVKGARYGTADIKDGKITYQLTKQLTGVEVLTYTAKATASSGLESDNKTATASVYIIPATSMYYEENFPGLVTFSGDWIDEGTPQTDPQEPGVVGTVGDSPYGSDAAYLNDSRDSNGSFKHVDTTSGAAQFSYTFTGTGTTFFARTTNNSGYMRVVIANANGETIYTGYRDTSYKNSEGTIGGDINVTGGTLYNIPVFTYETENYGTYTVTVTIAGGENAKNYGKEFWLDGIRVINPLDIADANASVATSAYATDGEANMAVVTLRQKLISEAQINKENDTISWNEGDNFVLFTDTNGKITSAEEYKSNGPKEEVYLNKDQSVTFSLYNWDANTNKIYLGVKAPVGNGAVSINGNTLNINNATDCYYDICFSCL